MAIPDYPGVEAREQPQPDICATVDNVNRVESRENQNAPTTPSAPPFEEQLQPRKKWGFSRVMWCAGWILCCPIFSCLYMMREKPNDKQDMIEDPCLPCYS